MAGRNEYEHTGGSEPVPPAVLPPELAAVLRSQPDYTCLTHTTSAGTAFVIKTPSADLTTVRGRVPIRVQHELYDHPAAPVLRTVLTIFDRPQRPLKLECFANVTDPDQRADFAALADQEHLVLLFYDQQLQHRLSELVPCPERHQVPGIVARAAALAAAIAPAQRDFDAAKAAVMERTTL
jgi:hypothetical protein